jgi:hypothetical protein
MLIQANEAGGSLSSPAWSLAFFVRVPKKTFSFTPPVTPPLTGRGNVSKMDRLRAQSARKRSIFDRNSKKEISFLRFGVIHVSTSISGEGNDYLFAPALPAEEGENTEKWIRWAAQPPNVSIFSVSFHLRAEAALEGGCPVMVYNTNSLSF